ncbi:MAG: hypothetical protein ACE5F1_19715 [Planctomycetota bacterium]
MAPESRILRNGDSHRERRTAACIGFPVEVIAFLVLAFTLGACRGVRELRFETLPDQVDRGGLADAGLAPGKLHPAGLGFSLEGSFVEELGEEGLVPQSYLMTIQVENRSEDPVELPWESFSLRSDSGHLHRPDSMLRWNYEEEVYEPAPKSLPPGPRQVLVLRFPAGSRVKPEHILRVCLHWGYRHAGRTHAVATRFAVH